MDIFFHIRDHKHSYNLFLNPLATSKEMRRDKIECFTNVHVSLRGAHVDHLRSSSVLVSRMPGKYELCNFVDNFQVVSSFLCQLDRSSSSLSFLLTCCIEVSSHCVAQAALPFLIPSPQPPWCWDQRHVPPYLTHSFFLVVNYSWSSFILIDLICCSLWDCFMVKNNSFLHESYFWSVIAQPTTNFNLSTRAA